MVLWDSARKSTVSGHPSHEVKDYLQIVPTLQPLRGSSLKQPSFNRFLLIVFILRKEKLTKIIDSFTINSYSSKTHFLSICAVFNGSACWTRMRISQPCRARENIRKSISTNQLLLKLNHSFIVCMFSYCLNISLIMLQERNASRCTFALLSLIGFGVQLSRSVATRFDDFAAHREILSRRELMKRKMLLIAILKWKLREEPESPGS